MSWLVWKDYRMIRPIVIVALALVILPHALAAWMAWQGAGAHLNVRYGMASDHRLMCNLVWSSAYSTIFLQFLLAVVGGSLIAGERVDRSADFLACLPASRGRILASKLSIAVTLAALLWIPNLVILGITSQGLQPQEASRFFQPLGTYAIVGLMSFCVAWLCSSMLESPTFASVIGLVSPLAVSMGMVVYCRIAGYEAWRDVLSSWETLRWYQGICLGIAILSFAGGTLYYLRRAEP